MYIRYPSRRSASSSPHNKKTCAQTKNKGIYTRYMESIEGTFILCITLKIVNNLYYYSDKPLKQVCLFLYKTIHQPTVYFTTCILHTVQWRFLFIILLITQYPELFDDKLRPQILSVGTTADAAYIFVLI